MRHICLIVQIKLLMINAIPKPKTYFRGIDLPLGGHFDLSWGKFDKYDFCRLSLDLLDKRS